MSRLLGEHGCGEVDLLKVDIEGAERVVVAKGVDEWLKRIRAIAIGLHGDECRAIVNRAPLKGVFTLSRSGELIIARRLVAR
jgi:hypothetical protein